jgi:hypothetical protein
MPVILNTPIALNVTYDRLHIERITINAPYSGADATAQCLCRPYSSTTGASSPEMRVVNIDSILTRIANGDQILLAAHLAVQEAIQVQIDLEDS